MSVAKYLQNSAFVALAAAIAITALPSAASAREEDERNNVFERRAEQVQRRNEQRAEQVDRRAEQRATQIDRRAEQRAAQVERRGDQAAAQAARRGDWGQARQVDRRSEQAVRQIEQRGDWRAQQAERRGDQRAAQIERRGDWRGQVQQRDTRNGTYVDQNRNRAYTVDGRRDGNDWRNDGRRGDDRWRDNDRRDDNNWQYQRRGDNDRRYDNNYQRWDRRWRSNDRYDWQRYRDRNRIVFRIGTYYSPYRSYSYRRLGIGYVLDQLFFGSRYWINDPWQYRLPQVYGPYRWVRYYDDVLLVDIYSGEVVDVIYDFFW